MNLSLDRFYVAAQRQCRRFSPWLTKIFRDEEVVMPNRPEAGFACPASAFG
jgi:hypothetical protein